MFGADEWCFRCADYTFWKTHFKAICGVIFYVGKQFLFKYFKLRKSYKMGQICQIVNTPKSTILSVNSNKYHPKGAVGRPSVRT